MRIHPNALCDADALFILERLGTGEVDLVFLDIPHDAGPKPNPPKKIRSGDGPRLEREKEYLHWEYVSKILQQTHRVLTTGGSIQLYSAPDKTATYCALLDQIFGQDNKVGEVIIPRARPSLSHKGIRSEHENVLVYGKSVSFAYQPPNRMLSKEELRRYKEDERGLYQSRQLITKSHGGKPFIWRGYTPPDGWHWGLSKEKLEKLYEEDRIILPTSGAMPRLKIYLDEHPRKVGSIWDDFPNRVLYRREEPGWSGQKPQIILERIIESGSSEGGLIVDPFCMSITSIVAAEKLGRRWVGAANSSELIELLSDLLTQSFSIMPEEDYHIWSQEMLQGVEANKKYQDRSALLFQLGKMSAQELVKKLAEMDESENLEFKEAAFWNKHSKKKDRQFTEKITQDVAGFLNKSGGTLLIGVTDDGKIVGLLNDIAIADKGKPTRDGYELALRNRLWDTLGADIEAQCDIEFVELDEGLICIIKVKTANKPVFFRGQLFVRFGNQTKPLSPEEAYRYRNRRDNE